MRIVEPLERHLPALFLVWFLPFAGSLIVLIPPWQVPDEPLHVARIVHIAHGGIVGRFLGPGRGAGGRTDYGVYEAALRIGFPLPNGQPVSRSMLDGSDAVRWHFRLERGYFANTVQYQPVLYAPGVIAYWVGVALDWSVNATLLLMRGCFAVAVAALIACALRLARRVRLAIAAVAILPMTVGLAAGATQDGMLIAATMLAVALIDRATEGGNDAGWRAVLAISALLAIVVSARPPFAPFALLLLMLRRRPDRLTALAAGGVLAVLAAWEITISGVVAKLRPDVDAAAQARHLLDQPLKFFAIMWRTTRAWGENWAAQFVGTLGWLDVPLPDAFYVAAWIALALALLAGGLGRRGWIAALAAVAAIPPVFLALYLTWTAPGAPLVEGVQGRYFIPIALVLAGAMPAFRSLRGPALIALGLLALVTPMVTLRAVVWRYYLAP